MTMGSNEMVLLSIHPDHASKILSGEKKLEFRRVWAKREISSLAIYVTVPVKKIVALAKIKCVHKGDSQFMWKKAAAIGGGLTKKELDNYFEGKPEGYAIEIDQIYRFPAPISPGEFFDNFRAPQSFAYVPNSIEISLRKEFENQTNGNRRRIYFVGGVHAVGKTTMCKKYVISHDLTHINAGDVIKRARNHFSETGNKRVIDVDENQSLLISGISLLRQNADFLLDGHFAVFDSSYKPIPIDISVFSKLGITGIIIIVDEPHEIAKRLAARDGQTLSTNDIGELQRLELTQGRKVARKLGICFAKVMSGDDKAFRSAIEKLATRADFYSSDN